MTPLSHLKSASRMAFNSKRNKFLRLERERLTRYQHQHRGLDFLKLWMPPTTDRKVNIIGLNNHIYKGKLPTFPEDRLPPEVDPKSVDEEELHKEIRDMRFPIIPPLRPLGPARRIGGEYTTAKKLSFAPVQINLGHDHTEMPILGADGKTYQGKSKDASVHELDRKLRGTNRPVKTPAMYRSDRGTVKPTVVSLYVDGKPPCERKPPVPLIQLPYADLNKLVKLMEVKTAEEKKRPESTEEQEKDQAKPADEEESKPEDDAELAMGESSRESVLSDVSESSMASESSTTTATEASSEPTDLEDVELVVSESEPEEASEPEPEIVPDAEVAESEPEDVPDAEVSESEPEE